MDPKKNLFVQQVINETHQDRETTYHTKKSNTTDKHKIDTTHYILSIQELINLGRRIEESEMIS